MTEGVSSDPSSQPYQNGTAIQQWDWLAGANQQWQIVDLGNGYNEIRNVQSGKVLDVRDVADYSGAVIQQWDWLGGENQQWQILPLSDGSVALISLHSHLALDVESTATENGAPIQQYDQWFDEAPAEHWILIPLDSSGVIPWTESSDASDADYQFFKTQSCKSPPFRSLLSAWACNSGVNILITDFTDLRPFKKAVDNWNSSIDGRYGFAPVYLWLNGGGPDKVWAHRVENGSIPCIPVNNVPCVARAQNTRGQIWHPNGSAQARLRYVEIQIVKGMRDSSTLTKTFAHELGHTFGLDDCIASDCKNSSVMDSAETPPTSTNPASAEYLKWNWGEGTTGPLSCDLDVIQNNIPDYEPGSCQNLADGSLPAPACTNGAIAGFADVGPNGEYTCNGAVCDGCNSACDNFAPGEGCSTAPDPTCSTYCGDACMDGLTCPGTDISSYWNPVCDSGAYVHCPADTNYSPIILDLFNEGFHLTSVQDGVQFVTMPGRSRVQLSWTDRRYHNGWLVMDRNGNGVIDNLEEMFGNLTPQPNTAEPNGYKALAVFDSPDVGGNGNGVIDAGDAVFNRLRIWIDDNHNGISEESELHMLREFHIESIGLAYSESPITDANGNSFRYKSFITIDGKRIDTRTYDVYLRTARPRLGEPR